jgi:nucleoside-diphosphate-sugar epimerase
VKVLVTGHKGYIGSVLVPLLVARGHEVTGLDSDLFDECTYTGALQDVPEFACDVRDATLHMVEGADAVIHLAGLSNDPLGDYDPALTDAINCQAAIRMARLAKQARVGRFLFASSCSTYGASGDAFLDESARFRPVTPYGESKVNVERAVSALADESFSPVFLRASTAYGMSPRIRFDLVVNNLVAWAFTTGEVFLKSDGSPWRPIVHVEDIALAYAVTLEAERELVHNRAFNVGSTAENYQIRDIAELVREVVPGSRIGFAKDAAPDKRCYRVDCNFIARTLHGFKPQWTARRGIEQLYDTFCRVGLKLEDFEGERYKRIAHMHKLIAEGTIDTQLRRREPVAGAASVCMA